MSSLRRVLCNPLPQADRPVPLAEQEANHLVQVYRMRNGDEVEALDGQGRSVRARLQVQGDQVRLHFVAASMVSDPHEVLPITLELAVLKGDAMEWAVEKAVELGVRRLVPVLTAHGVVKVKDKGPEVFRERWQKIADQALKQCGRLERMRVETPVPLVELLNAEPGSQGASRLWADEAGRGALPLLPEALAGLGKSAELSLLIGPEGGWSDTERELLQGTKARAVSLGPLVLRAETAALAALAIAAMSARLDFEQSAVRS